MKKYYLFCVLLAFSAVLFAQKRLALENTNRAKRIFFDTHDYIRFKTHHDKLKYVGKIAKVDDSVLTILKGVKITDGDGTMRTVFRDSVMLKDIRYIYKDHRSTINFVSIIGNPLLDASVMFGALALAEKLQKRPLSMNLPLAIGSFVTGTAWYIFHRKGYKIGNKWQIRAFDYYQ